MRNQNREPKKIPGKGNRKLRECLGPGCKKKFVTTPDIRLCVNCKNRINGIGIDDFYEVNITKKGSNE